MSTDYEDREREDRLEKMWEQQVSFMKLLQEKRSFPQFPVDIMSKVGQRFIKSITHECQEELFEANQLLKNSKNHRISVINEFDREAYIEELVDALHYQLEIAILSGITLEEFYEAYMKKGEKSVERIESGY